MAFAAVAASLLILAVACDEPAPVEPAAPVFPELVENYAVAPGDTLELTFTPNMDWEVSVPEDTMDFFWVLDNGFAGSRISGRASEDPVTVYVGVSDKVDFANHTTTVRLTMGGETRIIAKYMLPAKEKTLQMYVCLVDDDGALMFDDNGDYLFSESPAEDVRLIWSGSDFRTRIKVISNYDWILSLPKWAKADIPEVRVGTQEFNVYGVPSEYPLEDTTGELAFMDGDKSIYESGISIPGCRGILSFGVNGVTSIDFNDKGSYVSPIRFLDGPVTGWINGVEDVCIYPVEMKDGKYDIKPVSEVSWLDIDIAEYDDSEGADVLQKREMTISVNEYDGTDHSAVLLFLPQKADGDLSLYFNEDRTAVKDEWLESVCPVTFRKYGYITAVDPVAFAEAGATFELIESKNDSYVYSLVYDNEYASDNGRMLMLQPFSRFAVYDAAGVEVGAEDEYWLDFIADEYNDAGTVRMSSDKAESGKIIFYSDKSEVLAEIQCSYRPKEVVEDVSPVDVMVDASRYFVDSDAAADAGARMVEIQAGPTRRECEGAMSYGAILLKLSSPVDTPVDIKVPSSATMVAAYPRDSYDLGNIDLSAGAAYLEGKKSVTVSFSQFPPAYCPDENDPDAPYLIPQVSFYNKSYETVLVIYCEIVK